MTYSVTNIALVLLLATVSFGRAGDLAAPRDLNEAHQSLERCLSAADIARIRKMKSEEDVVTVVGMELTMGLTNEWKLWANSPLARYFKKLGVNEPHDMIGIVAETYWCKLHGRPFALRAKIAKLKLFYAREEKMKPHGKSPRDGAEIDWFYSISSSTGTLYLGVSASDGSFWRYDYRNRRGIEPAHRDEAARLTQSLEMSKNPGK